MYFSKKIYLKDSISIEIFFKFLMIIYDIDIKIR